MKSYNFIKSVPTQQRGIALLEALVSMIIIALACAGSLFVVSHANVTKTEMSMQHITVQKMQQMLSNHSEAHNACAAWHVDLPGVADGHRPAVHAHKGCNVAADGFEVKVGGSPIDEMSGRISLMAVDGNDMIGGDVVVGGS
jgi:Tfp pilus assembly protein PilV